ncbi:energy transducer TonB [Devosia beringensis]|uniref:energy transducer TonB n=1 Tax=Devosia beringensis TaxID=2657486 RepID=UPI00186B7F69|nr:energy transducer TonB [Devosia beringensis]
MRYALSGSALVHAGIFGTALLGFVWPQPEDAPAPGAVTVDIVTMETVSTNLTATQESMSTHNQVSAGAQAVQSQTVDPVESETMTPVEPAQAALAAPSVKPLPPTLATTSPPETAQAILSTTVAALYAASIAPLEPSTPDQTRVEPVLPAPAEVIEPVSVSDAKTAPVPQTLSFTRPSKPTPRPVAPRKPPPLPAQAAGNGGANTADAAAGKAAAGQQAGTGGGGAAEIAPWERQVRRKLASAQRYPRAANGASGDVLVSFTVSASGALSGLRIQASSGNPLLDQAALDTVARAAPFPPIPAGAGLASKAVAIPLGFVR